MDVDRPNCRFMIRFVTCLVCSFVLTEVVWYWTAVTYVRKASV